jgi:hypothetical protein
MAKSSYARDSRESLEQRRSEIAQLIACGVRRLYARRALVSEKHPETSADSDRRGLEVPDETVLTVHTG